MPLRQQILDLLGPSFAENVGRHVVPIFADRDAAPVSVGTGFLVLAAGRHLLITAAHVLDNIADGHSLYFYVATATKRAIAGTVLRSKVPAGSTRREDVIDIGLVILEGEGLPPYPDVNKLEISADKLAPFSAPRGDKKYAFLGFPSTKSVVTRPEKSVRSAAYAYLSGAVQRDQCTELGLSEETHIVLPFDARKSFHPDGRLMNFPKPVGISGSPLWELRRPEDGGPRVAGVMIEHRQSHKVVVATDIGFALRILEDYLIDCRSQS